ASAPAARSRPLAARYRGKRRAKCPAKCPDRSRARLAVQGGDISRARSVFISVILAKRMSVSANHELPASREQLRSIVNNVPVVLFALDLTGRITMLEVRGLESTL